MSEIYSTSEEKCQKTQRWIYIYLLSELTVYSICLINSIYCICIGNMDTSTWTTTYNLVIPFNENSAIWKWYLMWFTRFNMGMTYTACTTSITSYFVACCIYICAMCDHFGVMMRSTSEDVKQLHDEEGPKRVKLMRKFKEKLSQSIEIHVKIFSYVSLSKIDIKIEFIGYDNTKVMFILIDLKGFSKRWGRSTVAQYFHCYPWMPSFLPWAYTTWKMYVTTICYSNFTFFDFGFYC